MGGFGKVMKLPQWGPHWGSVTKYKGIISWLVAEYAMHFKCNIMQGKNNSIV